MPNTRGQGQKLIPVPADVKFIAELNAGFRQAGYANRSQFIRDAITEKLGRAGIKIAKKYSTTVNRPGEKGRQHPTASVKAPLPKKTPAKKAGETCEAEKFPLITGLE